MKFLVAFLFLFNTSAFAQSYMLLPVDSVYDGDTIKSNLGSRLPSPLNKVSIRINGIDTPERGWRAKCEAEANLAEEAKLHTEQLIGDRTKIKVTNYRWDKYGGRILADVSSAGVDFATSLIENGFAVPYRGTGPKNDWCK